jgi:hypothetical protein
LALLADEQPGLALGVQRGLFDVGDGGIQLGLVGGGDSD